MKLKKVKPKSIIISLVLVTLLFFSLSLSVQAGGSFYEPSIMNRFIVYKGGSDYTPDRWSYPFDIGNGKVKTISFSYLFGSSKDLVMYYGEVSEVHEKKHKEKNKKKKSDMAVEA